MRVLYVEDNTTNVILVQRVANMGKHEVINYDDGQTALDHFEQDKPDLILLDVQLRGGLTGLDVAHALRAKGCKLPVIAVTAYAMKGDRQRCLDAGCDDYLPKPISVAELVTVFKRYGDAVAAGKPVVSTFKYTPPAPIVANPTTSPPIVLTPTQVVPAESLTPSVTPAPSESATPAVTVPPATTSESAIPVVTPPATSPIAPEPSPAKDESPTLTPAPSDPVISVDSVAVVASSAAVTQEAPTPVNAES